VRSCVLEVRAVTTCGARVPSKHTCHRTCTGEMAHEGAARDVAPNGTRMPAAARRAWAALRALRLTSSQLVALMTSKRPSFQPSPAPLRRASVAHGSAQSSAAPSTCALEAVCAHAVPPRSSVTRVRKRRDGRARRGLATSCQTGGESRALARGSDREAADLRVRAGRGGLRLLVVAAHHVRRPMFHSVQ
jgi:hypothetical protein